MVRDLNLLQKNINYKFKNIELLKLALTHRSKRRTHNERLEFLGDAFLGAICADELYARFPEAKEGMLSQMRMTLIKGDTLTSMAQDYKINEFIEFGESELKSGGHKRERLLEDAFEAVIGAIYLDSGFQSVKSCVLEWYKDKLNHLCIDQNIKDPKTQLQEILQKNSLPLPLYSVINTEGKDHEKTFHVKCEVEKLNESVTVISNKRKVGEYEAARIICERLINNHEGLL
ncbi:MAG: ribonuclease-3 [Francisellaceae bacterium]|jgi:ribonuclease-3